MANPCAAILALETSGSIWLTPAQVLSVVLMVGGMAVLAWACRARPAGARAARPVEPVHVDPDPRSVVGDAEELLQLLAEQADQHAARLEQLIQQAESRIRKLEQLAAAPP